ncbi:Panacea domain-containing protein [Phycicoccus sp. Soil803]|uniref:Panacea domain-containing protein n=1 Tax=Phycicoccus sp. Soil803 TaxID=1736415 RepID=UPI001F32058D|nr:type II toxin-antitoxin system antitoxin SocA domain-containing protein [Phycicoccus sp. Soil803]
MIVLALRYGGPVDDPKQPSQMKGPVMASVHDVAAYILAKRGEMTAMKLQKLTYYSHAWHLVWDERPLFAEPIEAWANGPVVPALYRQHRGKFSVSTIEGGDSNRLTQAEQGTVDAVVGFYGDMTAHQLSELTHSERPWADARAGMPAGARGSARITDEMMAFYYDSLTAKSTSS